MKKKNSAFTSLVFVFVLSALFVVPSVAESSIASPQLPHEFYGSIEAGGNPVNPGLSVEAIGPGVVSGISGNPITTSSGLYGDPKGFGVKLIVFGDIEPGTPIKFYVGGLQAEVFPMATDGPWLEAYPYLPGEVTELNLRIASQPSVGETREPTPVQTRIPSGQVPAISGYSGPALPQPEVITTYQGEVPVTQTQAGEPAGPGSSSQPGTQGGESSGTPAPSSQEAGNPSSVVPATTGSGSSMLIGAAIVAFLVIIGAVAYFMSRKKPEDEKKEE